MKKFTTFMVTLTYYLTILMTKNLAWSKHLTRGRQLFFVLRNVLSSFSIPFIIISNLPATSNTLVPKAIFKISPSSHSEKMRWERGWTSKARCQNKPQQNFMLHSISCSATENRQYEIARMREKFILHAT